MSIRFNRPITYDKVIFDKNIEIKKIPLKDITGECGYRYIIEGVDDNNWLEYNLDRPSGYFVCYKFSSTINYTDNELYNIAQQEE